MKTISSLISLIVTAIFSIAAAAQDYEVPRTQWGQPDLQGVWNWSSNVPMQRPARFGDRQFLTAEEVEEAARRRAAADANSDAALPIEGVDGSYNDFWVENAGIGENVRTSHIVYPTDGRVPELQEGVVARQGVYGGVTTNDTRPVRISAGGIGADGPEDRGLSERCIIGFNAGPPMVPSLYNNNLQIFQNKDTAVLMTEMIHDARIIPIENRAGIVSPAIPQWFGTSSAHWEGDTLIVVTKNFAKKQELPFEPQMTSAGMTLTERFSPRGDGLLNYEYTVDHPTIYSEPWSAQLPLRRLEGNTYEYACHEGNYGLTGILQGSRNIENR